MATTAAEGRNPCAQTRTCGAGARSLAHTYGVHFDVANGNDCARAIVALGDEIEARKLAVPSSVHKSQPKILLGRVCLVITANLLFRGIAGSMVSTSRENGLM
jgi:hypothetical protein